MRIVKMRRCMAALLIAAIALSFGWIPSVVANADYAGGYSPGVTPGKVTFVMYPHAKASAGDQTPEMVAQLDIGSDGHIVGLIATKTAYLNVWASYNVQGYELSGWIDMATNQFVNLSLDTFPAEGVVLAAMFETQTVTYYSADFAAYSADKTAAAAPNFSTSYDVWTVLDKNSSIDPADWIYTRKEEIPVYNYWMMPERTVPDAIIDDQGNSIASFQGWALSESDANAGTLFSVGADGRTVVGTGVANGGNLKLYASYRSVTFYAPDGGGNTVLYKTPRALDGQNIPNPGAAPSAGGAKFTGWFTEGGAKYSFGQSLTDNGISASATKVKLFARYSDAASVVFMRYDGTPFRIKQVTKGTTLSDPPLTNAEMYGYPKQSLGGDRYSRFKAWSLTRAGAGTQTPVNFSTLVINSDVTLYPIMSEYIQYVTFVSEGKQVPFIAVERGSYATAPENPIRSGYNFAGWAREDNSSFSFSSMRIDSDITLYAKWTPKSVEYRILVWQERPNLTNGTANSVQNQSVGAVNGVIDANANGHPDPTHYESVGDPISRTAIAESATPAISTTDMNEIRARVSDFFYKTVDGGASTVVIENSSPTIRGDGSTVINVYFRRRIYDIRFTLDSAYRMGVNGTQYTGNTYRFFTKFQEDISTRWPSASLATFTRISDGADITARFSGWTTPQITYRYVSHQFIATTGVLPEVTAANSNIVSVNTFNVDSYTAQNIQVQLNYYFQCLPGESIDLTRGGVQYHRSTQYSQLAFSQNDSSWTHKEIAGLTPLRDAAYRESSPADGVPNNGDGVADVFFFYTRGAGRRIVFDRNMPGKTMTTDGMLRPNGATLPDDVVDLTGIYSKPRNYNSVMFGEALRYYSPLSDPELVGTTDDGKAYTFAGWYLKNDGAPATAYYIPINDVTVGDPNRGLNRFLTDTMPSEDLVLFAKWVPDPYTLEFADDVGHPDNGGVIFYRERDLFELIGSATSGDAGTDYSRDTGGGAPNPNDYRVGTTTVGERTFLGWYYAIGTENAQQLDIGRTQVSGGISRIFAKWSEVEGDITVVYMNSDSKIKWNWGRELWPWNRWLSGSDTPNAGVTQPVYSSTDRVYAMQPPSRNADLYQTGDRVDEFVGWELGKFVAGTWVAYGTRDSLGNLISGLVLSPNDELVIADYTDAITVIDSGNYAEYQVKLNSNANLVSKPYEPGKYLFFRPIFASDTKYGIVYEVDGKAYVHYANKYEKGESVRIHDADSFNGAFRDYNGGVDLISDSNPSGKKFVNWQVKIALDSTVERYGFPGEVTYEPGKLRNLRAAINYGYVHDADAVNDWYSTADESLVYGSWLKYNDVGDAVRYGVPEGNYIVLQPVYSYTITFDLNTTDDTARLTVNGHDYNNSDDMYLKPVTEGFAFANPGTAHVNSGATSLKWYYDSACTIEWNFAWEHYNEVLAGSDLNGNGILESGDMTLYASWDNDFSFAVRPSKSEIAYANDDKSGKPIGTALEAKFFVYIKDGVLLSTSALGDTSGANFGLASAGQVPTVKFYTKSGINNPSPDKELSIGVTGASLRYIGTESRDLERTGTAILYKKYEYSFNVSISDIRNAIRDVTNNTDRVVAFLEVTAKKGGAIFLSSDTLGAGSLNDPAKSTICLYQKGIRLTT